MTSLAALPQYSSPFFSGNEWQSNYGQDANTIKSENITLIRVRPEIDGQVAICDHQQ
jgi:hypothetical protein